NTAGTTTFAQGATVASLATDAPGSTVLGGDVTTTAAQNYGDNLQVSGNLTAVGVTLGGLTTFTGGN
ncbi:MAG TPA: hypothetical protein DCY13_24370, partial [Verrucomicrobiales bacterium]|nr:hypothetical protein [Verrucomicrobiales bacterium]